MKVINFEDLNNVDVSFDNIFSMTQNWENYSKFNMLNPRKNNALLYFYGCDGIYKSKNGNKINAKQGDIIYLPKCSQYYTQFLNKTKQISTVLIEFDIRQNIEEVIFSNDIKIIHSNTNELIKNLFLKIANEFSLQNHSLFSIKSYLYEIFNIIQKNNLQKLISNSFNSIKKGIEYLENDISQKLSIEEVAALCNVSNSYFRKQFKAYSGYSPIEYRLNKKIFYAQKLLINGEYSVSQISDMLGFSDVSYFSKIFKNKTGKAPKQFQNY